jgi:hypothetical protein
MEWQQITIVVRLVPNRVAIGQVDCSIITKSTHAPKHAIVVIKASVLLHHNDEVFNASEKWTTGFAIWPQ